MTSYIIKVHNKSDKEQTFLLLNEKPSSSNNISQVWNNVWVKSHGVNYPYGSATFGISSTFFAVCGESSDILTSGVTVETSDWKVVGITITIKGDTTNGTKVTMEIKDRAAMFSKNFSTTSKTGSFAIKTDTFNATDYRKLHVHSKYLLNTWH